MKSLFSNINQPYKWVPEALLLTLFFWIFLPQLNLDFWNDEIYTLKNFTFVPLSTTITDYHVPNNHVFFNLINNLYLKALGFHSFDEIAEFPFILRLLPLIYTFLACLFLFKTVAKFLNRETAIIALVLVLTTLPTFYFSLQIRGYGLSFMLITLSLYYALNYRVNRKKKQLLWSLLFGALLVYTIPSNYYILLSFILFFGFRSVIHFIQSKFSLKNLLEEVNFRITIGFFGSILISLLLYAVIFQAVFFNEYVVPLETYDVAKLLEFYFPHLTEGIVSGRFWLFPLAGIGLFISIVKYRRFKFVSLAFLSLFFIPLLMVFLRGDNAPLRIFIPGIPFLLVFIAFGLQQLLAFFSSKNSSFVLFALAISSYSIFVFYSETNIVKQHIAKDIEQGLKSQDLYRQYYSHHYTPLVSTRNFNQKRDSKIPLVIVGCDGHGIPNYLEKFGIPYFKEDKLDSLKNNSEQFYVVTNHPKEFTSSATYEIKSYSDKYAYHNFFLIKKDTSFLPKIKELAVGIVKNDTGKIGTVFNFNKNDSDLMLSDSISHLNLDYNNSSSGILQCFLSDQNQLLYLEEESEKTSLIRLQIAHYFKELKSEKLSPFIRWTYFEKRETPLLENLIYESNSSEIECLDALNQYSKGLNSKYNKLQQFNFLKINFQMLSPSESNAIVVFSIDKKGKNLFWKGKEIKDYYCSDSEWNEVLLLFDIPQNIPSDAEVSVFIWNTKEEIQIKNFRIGGLL